MAVTMLGNVGGVPHTPMVSKVVLSRLSQGGETEGTQIGDGGKFGTSGDLIPHTSPGLPRGFLRMQRVLMRVVPTGPALALSEFVTMLQL